MGNKLQTIASSKLLENKAKILFKDLNKDFSELNLQEKEEILMKYNDTVKKLYSTLATPLLSYPEFRQGKPVDIQKINTFLKSTEQDLKTIYAEFSNIRSSLAGNFNSLNIFSQRVRTKIAKVLSDLADYKAQNKNIGVFTFSDSFNTMEKVESDSNKYKGEKCFIDNDWQSVTLPLVESDPEAIKIKRLSINKKSNGVPGNNQEISALKRDTPSYMNDQSLDTWYEYEKVSKNNFENPLVLEFEIELEEEKIINLIELSLVNFPNGSYPTLTEISTSNDGQLYIDFFNNYIGKTFIDSRGDEVIQLGSTDSNPIETTRLLFFPKKAKYLRIKLIQDSDFIIRTASGLKNRQAIGIKEIAIKGIKFKNAGEFISKNFSASKEIGKVFLKTNEYLPEGFKIKTNYSVSSDDGQQWHGITPTQKTDSSNPEVINFNLDFISDAIKTENPVTEIKLKGEYKIDKTEALAIANSIKVEEKNTEFKSISAGTKTINLQYPPLKDVKIYNIGFGSIGGNNFYAIPNSFIYERELEYVAKLPREVFPKERISLDSELVFCEDYLWKRVDNLLDYDATERVYEFDYINNELRFASVDDLGDQHGKKPKEKILIKFKREKALAENKGAYAEIITKLQHDAVKESCKLYKLSEEDISSVKLLKPRSQVHSLGITEISSINIITDEGGNLISEKDFLNGYTELDTLGDFSVDYLTGVLYTYSEIKDYEQTEVEVFYKTREEIPFEIKEGSIQIKKDDYITLPRDINIDLSTPSFVIDLGQKNIEKGSLVFTIPHASLQTEVEFNYGREFDNIDDVEGPYSIDYREGVIYLPSKISGTVGVRFNTTNFYIEYNIASEISKTDILLYESLKQVSLSDDYIIKFFSDSNISSSAGLFKIEYSYAKETKEPPKDLLPYVTPILDSYELQVVFKEDI